jgi:preprotein translocase subunit SecE
MNETYMELKKVTWPSREEATRLTLMVILISVAVGAALGIIDTLFAEGLAVTLLR